MPIALEFAGAPEGNQSINLSSSITLRIENKSKKNYGLWTWVLKWVLLLWNIHFITFFQQVFKTCIIIQTSIRTNVYFCIKKLRHYYFTLFIQKFFRQKHFCIHFSAFFLPIYAFSNFLLKCFVS